MNLDNEKALLVVAILLQAGILVYFVKKAVKKKRADTTPQPAHGFMPGSYEEKRHTALQVKPQQLGLVMQPSVTRVYGVVMDWDMNGTVLTLCGYITGAANAFLSSGSSMTGVGAHPAIADKAAEFVQVAQAYIGKCMPVADTGLPLPGTVRFYLLTNNGVFAAQELLSSIEDNSSAWVGLFMHGNMLLDEMKQGA